MAFAAAHRGEILRTCRRCRRLSVGAGWGHRTLRLILVKEALKHVDRVFRLCARLHMIVIWPSWRLESVEGVNLPHIPRTPFWHADFPDLMR